MRRHIQYAYYVLRHKWFVLMAAFIVPGGGLRLLLDAITHDLSKIQPSEWFPYARCFYAPNGSKQYKEDDAFTRAWLHHQKRNRHHWQYWLITWDRGATEPLPMPTRCILEMVADWMGAGRAITGKWEVKEWYEKSKANIQVHPETRVQIESILSRL